MNHCLLNAGKRHIMKGISLLKVPSIQSVQKQSAYNFTKTAEV